MLRFLTFLTLAFLAFSGLVASLGAWIFLSTPRPTNIRGCFTTQLYQVYLCPKDKDYARLKEISPYVQYAIIVSEDGSFYSHNGFDWFELQQSFEKNWQEGRFARGGSTLTQQLAKNVYLTKDKSLLRKIREAIIVVQLERDLKKDEILEKYLNVVQFGPEIFGIRKAARFYFKKTPQELNATEAAFLAFLLPNPDKYSSSFRKKQLTKFARAQIAEILKRMMKFKKISEDEYTTSLAYLDRVFSNAPALPDEGQSELDDISDSEIPALAPAVKAGTPPEQDNIHIDQTDVPNEMPDIAN